MIEHNRCAYCSAFCESELCDACQTQEQAEKILEGETDQIRPFKAIRSIRERHDGGIFGRIRDRIDIWMRGLEFGH